MRYRAPCVAGYFASCAEPPVVCQEVGFAHISIISATVRDTGCLGKGLSTTIILQMTEFVCS